MILKHFARKYLREGVLPSTFCPGCGLGIIMNCFLKAVEELGYSNLNDFIFCSGIGCTAWIPSPHFKADSIHTLHGRAVAAAFGVKMVRPEHHVVVFGGDGDIAGIGIGHLIHAAKRNLEIVVIMANNFTYAMTGGQLSPTTPFESLTLTSPYGNIEKPLDVVKVMDAAGASFVARWTTYHVIPLIRTIKTAIKKNGFSFIEVVSQCPTIYGRRAGFKSSYDMLKYFKEHSVPIEKAKNMSDEELKDKFVVGIFVDREKLGFTSLYKQVINKARVGL